MRMRKIIALDPGTATTGYAVIFWRQQRTGPQLIEYGCIETSPQQTLPQRLSVLAKDLRSLIKKHRPNEMVVEKLFFAKNVKTGIAVGQARGVILLLAGENKLPVYEYSPAEIKRAVTGYGQAPKKQIQNAVKKTLKLKKTPRSDDAADAIAAGLCHLQTNFKIK
jgi:crossover junction endodeoxyribonuclease RuvC